MTMSTIPLEITIKSAYILKNVNFFNRRNIYTIVSLISNNSISTHKTNIDHHNSSQPFWFYKMKFNVDESKIDENSCMLVIQVRCKRTLGGDKDIGFLYIPVRELFQGREVYCPKDVAYTVSTSSGKPKGILYLSYEFGEKIVGVKRGGEDIRVPTPSAPPCYWLEDGFPASATNHFAPSAPPCGGELEGEQYLDEACT